MRPLALVTGGSAGIGRELSELLANDGYDLVITGSSARVDAAAEDLRALGADVVAVKSDLATEAGNEAVFAAVLATGRTPAVAIFNAGIATGGAHFTAISLSRHLSLMALNMQSPVRLAHALVPRMVATGAGKIMFVSSISATTPTPFEGVYGPSKAFLSSFGFGLREELVGTGVDVTVMCPGATATEFHARAGFKLGESRLGDNSWKNDPKSVAQQGYDAMLRGDAQVVCGDEATQEASRLHARLSEEEKARRHAEIARQRACEKLESQTEEEI